VEIKRDSAGADETIFRRRGASARGWRGRKRRMKRRRGNGLGARKRAGEISGGEGGGGESLSRLIFTDRISPGPGNGG